MGNFIFGENGGDKTLNSKNKEMLKTFKKKLVLVKVCDTLKIYVNECYPEVQLTEK